MKTFFFHYEMCVIFFLFQTMKRWFSECSHEQKNIVLKGLLVSSFIKKKGIHKIKVMLIFKTLYEFFFASL
jgi:hypothetical protein